MSRDLRLMMRYSAWANERLFAALAMVPPEILVAKRPTGTATILSTLGHAHVVDFQFVGGTPGTMTRGDMLLHVANHKTYHRGYVAEMLYQKGLKPPTMDLPVFLRDAPPALAAE